MSEGEPKGSSLGKPLRKQNRTPGLEPHVILGLQVPGLLAQKAKDVGEVLVPNLIKHLEENKMETIYCIRSMTCPFLRH